jgi:ankyrin repeat protein
MVDGFDEISPRYKETVFGMLQVLRQTSLEQLWVTTRPHLREELEDNLQQLSYTLQPFCEFEQVEFLIKFWLQASNIEATNQRRLQMYAEALIRKFAQSIRDKDKKFTGIPLQTRMLAEAFPNRFNLSENSEPQLPHKLDLLCLYEEFIERKYKRTETQEVKMQEIEQREVYLHDIHVRHRLLALEALFPDHEPTVTFLQINDDKELSTEKLARIGIAQRNSEGKPQFIHRTFAEYYVADFLKYHLAKETKQHEQVQEFLLNEVLLRSDCHVIRAFLDKLLEKSKPSNEALKEYGGKLEQWKKTEEQGTLKGVTAAVHTAVTEDNGHIVGFLLDSLKSGEHFSTWTEMLLATDCRGRTAWHKAAENDSVQALEEIWQWAEEVNAWKVTAARDYSETSDTTRAPAEEGEVQPNQIKNQLFQAKDQYGNTAWHGAAQSGSSKALETLWMWAKEEQLNTDDLLLAQNEEGNTVWQLAAQTGHLNLLQKLGVWAKEAQLRADELQNKLLLAKDKYGYTLWHRAAESGNLEALETLWDLVKEPELKLDEIFLDQGKDGNTAWQMTAQRGHFKVLEKLWEWANGEQMNGYVLKEKLILARNQYGCTTWHPAAERGSLKALEILWRWAKEAELHQGEMKKKFFIARDKQGETTCHSAGKRDHFEVLEKLWVWSKEAQNCPNDLTKEMLLAKDQYGYTVWHRAAQRGSLEVLETLCGWAEEVNLNPNDLRN